MKKRFFALFLMTIMCLSPTNVYAENDNELPGNDIIETVGLIQYHNVTCTVGTKKVHLKLEIQADYTMDDIGFKNITIQRSSNTYNWTNEDYANDQLIDNDDGYVIYDLPVWVNGGYYYRAYVEHYAKSYGGSEETIGDYSNYVWVG